jgi:hypothetical protein
VRRLRHRAVAHSGHGRYLSVESRAQGGDFATARRRTGDPQVRHQVRAETLDLTVRPLPRRAGGFVTALSAADEKRNDKMRKRASELAYTSGARTRGNESSAGRQRWTKSLTSLGLSTQLSET